MSAREADDHPRYACKACDYQDNEYALTPSSNTKNGSIKHEIAVCPDCHSELRLWIDAHR